ncbi:GNAT family N-acetyltransferase [uncultured Pontibacter sp.]|uniref:GNAT family N-acetyltransferase n=1 Tax=uncultured Pontibacter sp. TaxID=453356 RepID=UPI0026174F48|nr:GNAT family N-acetyltransferase [uncultured Pontibacter sp.]
MQLHIRTATVQDLRQVKHIDEALFKEDAYPMFVLRQFLDVSGHLFKVAVLNEAVAGYVLGSYNVADTTAWFLSLGVLPEYRGKGIGEALMHTLMNDVKGRGANAVYLTVHPENASAIKLYGKLGFRTEFTDPDYYLDGSPRLVMRNIIPQV